MWSLAWVLVHLIVAVAVPPAGAAERWSYPAAERIIAFGDVHGACDALEALLRDVGVIDADGHWSAGRTHLVSVGDLVDRGPGSRCALDLIRRLEREARRKRGRVHLVLGNHEIMLMTGDRRYVSTAGYLEFADDPATALSCEAAAEPGQQPRCTVRREVVARFVDAFGPRGSYGRWLLRHPVVTRIGRTVFLHGGVSQYVGGTNGAALNAEIKRELGLYFEVVDLLERRGFFDPLDDQEQRSAKVAARLEAEDLDDEERVLLEHYQQLEGALLFHPQAPYWYRGSARHPLAEEEPVLAAGLAALGAERAVVGHTPTPDRRVRSRFGGRLLMIDTGMLASYFHGRASALELTPGGVRVYYADEGRWAQPVDADALEQEAPPQPLESGSGKEPAG